MMGWCVMAFGMIGLIVGNVLLTGRCTLGVFELFEGTFDKHHGLLACGIPFKGAEVSV